MSTAAEAPPAKKGLPKKLIIIAVVVILVLVGGVGAIFVTKQRQAAAAAAALAAEEAGDDDEEAAAKPDAAHAAKHDDSAKGGHQQPPIFIPLDPFVVNLADRDADRYLQVGLTLETQDPHAGDLLKSYMPAIRNAILLVLSHKTSADLLSQQGKEQLATEIRSAAARAMGLDVEGAPEVIDPHGDPASKSAVKKKKKKKTFETNPIVHVHYANFIIQ
jgi:flagellar FliL protein